MLSSLNAATAAPTTDASVAVLDAPAVLDVMAQATTTAQAAAEVNSPAFQDVFAQGAAQATAQGADGQSDLLFTELATGVDSPATQRADEPEIDAELWLSHALDQQSVQLQVRDLQGGQATEEIAAASLAREQALSLRQLAANSAAAQPRSGQPATAMHRASIASASGPALLSGKPSDPYSAPPAAEQAATSPALALWANRPADSLAANSVQANSVQANPVQATAVQQGAELLAADSAALAGATADVFLPAERTAGTPSALANSMLGLGDKAVQDTGFQAAVKLPTPDAKWGEQLLHTLRDQVQVQIQQRIQNATIRLDPPELGSLEIFLSHESGRLNVHITASQADVGRLLQQTSDRLRQELAGGQFTQVNVQTSSDGQSGQQHSRHNPSRFAAEEMIQLNGQPVTDKTRGQSGQASDVLITV